MKKTDFKKVFISLAFSFVLSLPAQAYSDSQVRQSIDDYIYSEKNLKKSVIGVKVRDLKTNQDIYSVNSEKLLIPASTTKVFTSLIALEKLGKDYTFKTTLNYDGNISKDNLKGNLYLKFVGDPTLKHKDLDNLFLNLKSQNIKTIDGNVVIDRSIFDKTYYGPGWMWDDMDSCDSSPIDALYLDDNCIKAKISAQNNKINVETDNQINFNTDNLLVTDQENVQTKYSDNNMTVSGKIKNTSKIEIEQSISNPEKYLESYLKKYLTANFNFKGKIIFDDKAYPSKQIAVKESIPLSEILKRFNKESHNLTGELLTKTVGSEDSLPGSTRKGVNVLKNYLETNFNYTDFKIVDGSGLSRYNLFSPDLMVDVLSYIYAKPDYREIFLAAFPVGAKEGTLKNRLLKFTKYKVIAKSGSMTGINCLSGFLINDNNAYAFSIMINNSNLSGQQLRDIQDHILYLL